MKYCKLGKTDLSVSVIAMGCWALAGGATWGAQEEQESIAAVHAALDAGVNFFDTAEAYEAGATEVVLGKALMGRRHQAVIATKVSRGQLSAQEVQQACQDSLQRLQTDYIDLYQIHWPRRTVPLAETVAALERLRDQGKVRAIGVCNFGVQDLSEILALGWVESNQLPYSLLWRAIEYEIQQACIDQSVGILCYSPLSQGLLAGKYASADDMPEGRARTRLFSTERPQARHGEPGVEVEAFAALKEIRAICDEIGQPMVNVALAWLLQQPGVTSVIAGARRPGQIRQTAQATDLVLSSETLTSLSAATGEVRRLVGPNPDMWQTQSRFR
jgi:aryl-alcohol dehydrogenase-like predicted oxidoreductase